MNTLFTLPALLAGFALIVTTWLVRPASAAPAAAPTAKSATQPVPQPAFKAQVVGIQWLNPLVRRDYPTEWQLLWTLGLAKPNNNDEKVQEKPQKFSSVQPIASIVNAWNGETTFARFFGGYMREILRPIGRRYALNRDYFYTIQPDDPKHWRELHGIHMQIAVPATPQMPVEQAAAIVREAMRTHFQFYNPKLSTANTPADVHVTAGGANAGFTSLDAALDYLQANPSKTVWVMTWDAPDHPKDEQMTENCTLLVLAGPQMNTDREPLAWIARPARARAGDFQTREGASKTYQAWEAALRQAATQADIAVGQTGYVIHDAGTGAAVGKSTAGLTQALTILHPELNFLEDGFNTPKLLGDMRAGTAVTNLALAVAWTHQKGKPVLVAGTTEPDEPVLVVVTPPARPRIANPDKNWFRARGEGNAYLPWWGLRKDYDWSKYMQGFSD